MPTLVIPVKEASADTWANKVTTGLSANNHAETTLIMGNINPKSGSMESGALLRFDVDLPAGITFTSVTLDWTHELKTNSPESKEWRWQMLEHDTLWERSNAFNLTSYPLALDLPFSYKDGDTVVNLALNYPGDANGVISHTIASTILVPFQRYHWGEGAGEDETFIGATQLFQDFFDTHEADRNANGASGIACAIEWDMTFGQPAGGIIFDSEDAVTTFFRPTLTLTYDLPPVAAARRIFIV